MVIIIEILECNQIYNILLCLVLIYNIFNILAKHLFLLINLYHLSTTSVHVRDFELITKATLNKSNVTTRYTLNER